MLELESRYTTTFSGHIILMHYKQMSHPQKEQVWQDEAGFIWACFLWRYDMARSLSLSSWPAITCILYIYGKTSQSITTTSPSYRSTTTQVICLRRELISGVWGFSHNTSQSSNGEVRKFQQNACLGMRTSQPLMQVLIRRQQRRTWSTSQPNQLQKANDPTLPALTARIKMGNWHLASSLLSVDTADFAC